MIDLSAIDLSTAVKHYIFANTPAYLYRKLRQEQCVAQLACATPEQLLSSVSAIDKSAARTPEDIAKAYAMLVALNLTDYAATRRAVEGWSASNLSWASDIISIATKSAIMTGFMVYEGPAFKNAIAPNSAFGALEVR